MKINELIKSVAKLVESREIIDHGSIRCLYSAQSCREIEAAEGCDEVDTGEIGDDDLASDLANLAEDGDQIADLHLEDLVALERAYLGDDITSYLAEGEEDELQKLDSLIEASRSLV